MWGQEDDDVVKIDVKQMNLINTMGRNENWKCVNDKGQERASEDVGFIEEVNKRKNGKY